jgi:hypothetical protein
MSLQTEVDSPAHQNRVDRYLELGFSHLQAELLANARTVELARDSKGNAKQWQPYLYHGQVKTLLAQGATHAQCVAIFS